ncbi:YifB family Mg chelatase-like AAA ATPase [Brackiella oedipodis]|uniref:YifB family Mg chelatase-like AAA ATPase n=1 Tax=Brackiella oedipodis TaxID=124225 RepID=UPI00048DDE71
MELAVLNTCALSGLSAPLVRCEVHIAPGLPAFTIVGLPDTGIRESRERVRAAILSSGYSFPAGRITANLSPADLPKESSRFDLPIALGILLATAQIQMPERDLETLLPHLYFVGELSLTGALIPVRAPLVLALAIYQQDPRAVLIVPEANGAAAACVPGLTVYKANTLGQIVAYLNQSQTLKRASQSDLAIQEDAALPCMSDIKGQAQACYALEIAASGGHGLLMQGPPGVGKSMLAQRLPGILPDLTQAQRLQVMAIYSLTQSTAHAKPVYMTRPFRSPHHSSSVAAIVGGGAIPKPGEISLAHHGILFLDELPEFDRRVLEALREPLETGEICISRARSRQVFPAKFQLIAAANPCPCGYLGHLSKPCRCPPEKVQKYQSKLSGPLLDRIDIHLTLQPLSADWMSAPAAESSAIIKERVIACRQRQYQRQAKLNAHLTVADLRTYAPLEDAAQSLLNKAIKRFAWSGRVSHRAIRVARTVADMQQHECIQVADMAQAITLSTRSSDQA